MISVSENARRPLATLSSPEGQVTRLARTPEAHQRGAELGGELAFGQGRGGSWDQIVQHDGRQVLRIDPSLHAAGLDGSTVEVVEGVPRVVTPGPLPEGDVP